MSAAPSPAMLGRGGEAGGTDTTDPRPKRGSVTSLLILSLFVFIMTNNGSNDDLAARNQYRDTLSSLEWQFANYSAWLSGSDDTNFVLVRLPHVCLAFLSYAPNPNISDDQPARPPGENRIISDAVPHRGVLDPLVQSYYSNITGFVRGNASFRNFTSELVPALEWNETEVAQKLGRWNWSATNKVAMSLLSRPVDVDEKEKDVFKDVAMLHVSHQVLPPLGALESIIR